MNDAVNLIAVNIVAFAQAKTTTALIAMIALDLISGIVAALRARRFEFQRIGAFYLTNVIPYLIGYCGLYVFMALGWSDNLDPVMLSGLQGISSGPALLSLGGSIADNMKRAQYRPAPPHETADVPVNVTSEPPVG